MKGILTIWISIFAFSSCFGQIAFSEIIEIDSANVNTAGMKFADSIFIMASIYFDTNFSSNTSITSFNIYTTQVNDIVLERYTVSKNTPLHVNENIYLYGKDRRFPKGLEVRKVDKEYNTLKKTFIATKEDYDLPSNPIVIGSDLYLSAYIEKGNREEEYSLVAKLDTNLNEIWKQYFNEVYEYSYLFRLEESIDNQIFVSSNVLASDPRGFYNQLLKLDTAGNIIWEFFNDEELEHGAVKPHVITLADSTIVISYSVNRLIGNDFPNNLHPFPYRLIWLDHEGKLLKRRYYTTPHGNSLHIFGLRQSEGAGFYFFGSVEGADVPGIKGSLVKLDDEGDTIFHRAYYHPNFPPDIGSCIIKDIHEFQDGRIAVLANVGLRGDYRKIWIFMVDSNGNCLHEDCISEGGLVGLQSREVSYHQLTLYPNPTSETLRWVQDIPFKEIKVLDMFGRVVHESKGEVIYELNISHVSSGTYILIGKGINDIIYRSKFVKQ